MHDWNAKLDEFAATLPKDVYNEIPPFAFKRPDGTIATVAGVLACTVLIDGNHRPGREPHGYRDPHAEQTKVSGYLIDKVFSKVAQVVATTTVAALREAFGPYRPSVEVTVRCDECSGTGESECYACGHECECDECDGTGAVTDTRDEHPQRFLRVGGSLFSSRVAARVVEILPDCDATLGLFDLNRFLVITGDGWQVRQAAYRPDPPDPPDYVAPDEVVTDVPPTT